MEWAEWEVAASVTTVLVSGFWHMHLCGLTNSTDEKQYTQKATSQKMGFGRSFSHIYLHSPQYQILFTVTLFRSDQFATHNFSPFPPSEFRFYLHN